MIKKILEILRKPKYDDIKRQLKDNSPKKRAGGESPSPILTKHEALASFIQATDGQPARNLSRV